VGRDVERVQDRPEVIQAKAELRLPRLRAAIKALREFKSNLPGSAEHEGNDN
jgi:hypothetical protein